MPTLSLEELRRRNHDDARRSILEAADGLVTKLGRGEFSMRRLAAECGCTAATIYHYFRDKPGLISSLVDMRLARLADELCALPLSGDPVLRLRDVSVSFAHFARQNPGHYQLIVEEERDDAPAGPGRTRITKLFDGAVQALVDGGHLPSRDREGLREGVWSLIHGFLLLQATVAREQWQPGLLDRSLDALIQGWLVPGDSAAVGPP